MSTYILIMTLAVNIGFTMGATVSVESLSFSSENTCLEASKKWIAEMDLKFSRKGYTSTSAICVKK